MMEAMPIQNDQRCRIKICGFKHIEQMKHITELDVDQIGFVFAKSKRQVTMEQAREMAEALRNGHSNQKLPGFIPQIVGVFVNHPLDQLQQIIDQVKLDVVQLHGNESLLYMEQLKQNNPELIIWKVISVEEEIVAILDGEFKHNTDQTATEKMFRLALEQLVTYVPTVDAYLLDTPGGGTGKTFRWDTISAYSQACRSLGIPLYVAGGLHPDNVEQLLQRYAVDGVDVSSGVETDGEKDWTKIHLFVRKVRES
ncbi:phosphoribosylanthranilate isomerase [Paenibacillus yanchengensis]|uniref:N-(5'-phosphoribosyl)anthranilate isomerase n=1 Tax=Paenibacillus yanchengensis TaxID=2035833 RepID=A0ABW4YK59_9BACL